MHVLDHLSGWCQSAFGLVLLLAVLYTLLSDLTCTPAHWDTPEADRVDGMPSTSSRAVGVMQHLLLRVRHSLIFFSSNPFSAALYWNVGVEGLNYQCVNYVLHHQVALNRWVHMITIPIDAVAHLTLMHSFIASCIGENSAGSKAASAVTIGLLTAQVLTFRNLPFAALMSGVYCLIHCILHDLAGCIVGMDLPMSLTSCCQMYLVLSA